MKTCDIFSFPSNVHMQRTRKSQNHFLVSPIGCYAIAISIPWTKIKIPHFPKNPFISSDANATISCDSNLVFNIHIVTRYSLHFFLLSSTRSNLGECMCVCVCVCVWGGGGGGCIVPRLNFIEFVFAQLLWFFSIIYLLNCIDDVTDNVIILTGVQN